MAVLGSLNLFFKVDSRGASRKVNAFGKSLSGLKKIAIGAAASLGGVLGAQYLKSISEGIDAQAKFAKRVDISVMQLRRLQFAAGEAGVEARNLNTGIQRMTRRIGESLVTGTGQAKDALNALGLSLKDIEGLDAAEQFKAIGTRLGQVDDQGKKLAITFKLFDTEGAGLVNLFDEMARSGGEVGAAFDDVGAAITDIDAQVIETMNDNVGRLTGLTEQLAQVFVAKLAPFVNAAAEQLLELNKGGKVLTGLGNLMEGLLKITGKLVTAFNLLKNTFSVVFNFGRRGVAGLALGIAKLGRSIGEFTGNVEFEDFFKNFERGSRQNFEKATKNVENSLKRLTESADFRTLIGEGNFETSGDLFIKKVKEIRDVQIKSAKEAFSQINKGSESVITKVVEKAKTGVKGLAESTKRGIDEALGIGVSPAEAEKRAPTFAQQFDSDLVDINALATQASDKSLQEQKKTNEILTDRAANLIDFQPIGVATA